jgi:putative PIN family toxin of toxin-antitoxin system
MVFLQAAVRDAGPAFACLQLAEGEVVELLVCPSLLAEVRDVLSRPEICSKFQLSGERVLRFLARIDSCATAGPDPPKAFTLPRDPDDERYLNLAIAGGADYLVSWNERHLNYLMRADTTEGRDFCARYPILKIATPVEFLKVLRQTGKQRK